MERMVLRVINWGEEALVPGQIAHATVPRRCQLGAILSVCCNRTPYHTYQGGSLRTALVCKQPAILVDPRVGWVVVGPGGVIGSLRSTGRGTESRKRQEDCWVLTEKLLSGREWEDLPLQSTESGVFC